MEEKEYQKIVSRRKKRNMSMFRRIHTRKIDRMVAKHNMEKSGVSVHDMIKRHFFPDRWKEYANMNI